MSRMFQLLGAGVLAVAVAASASAAPAQTSKTATKKAAAHSVTGTLEKYDASGNAIVVKTAKGDETMSIGSATSIRMGAARLAPADLTGHTGQKVKVRYTEANGKMAAQTVQFERATRTARAETPAKTPAAKK
jgi:hypothetical protein